MVLKQALLSVEMIQEYDAQDNMGHFYYEQCFKLVKDHLDTQDIKLAVNIVKTYYHLPNRKTFGTFENILAYLLKQHFITTWEGLFSDLDETNYQCHLYLIAMENFFRPHFSYPGSLSGEGLSSFLQDNENVEYLK